MREATVHLHPAIVLLPDRERTRTIVGMERRMGRVFLVRKGKRTFVRNIREN